ncbi:MAG: hypothetical protein QXN55_01580 [Candidatus Nitrosotenuis sp.]
MDYNEIKNQIKNGNLILENKKLYTREEYAEIIDARSKEEEFDLLQHTMKISL